MDMLRQVNAPIDAERHVTRHANAGTQYAANNANSHQQSYAGIRVTKIS